MIIRTAALGALSVYRRVLSPVFYFFGARCRHEPSCSEYAADAFRRHRASRAFWLTLSRLARCHPLGSHGYDPVPDAALDVGWRFWRLGDWSWRERTGVDQSARANSSENERSAPSSSTRSTSA